MTNEIRMEINKLTKECFQYYKELSKANKIIEGIEINFQEQEDLKKVILKSKIVAKRATETIF